MRVFMAINGPDAPTPKQQRVSLLNELIDEASGPFSFVSFGTRLTYDWRRVYNKLILAQEWR